MTYIEGKKSYAIDVVVHPDGRIFVLDKDGMMMKYSDDGVLIETWVVHSLGAKVRNGRTKFRTISLSLSQDLQFLYVVNSRENKIQKYTLDGTFVTEWGGKRESASDALRSSQGVSSIVEVKSSLLIQTMSDFKYFQVMVNLFAR